MGLWVCRHVHSEFLNYLKVVPTLSQQQMWYASGLWCFHPDHSDLVHERNRYILRCYSTWEIRRYSNSEWRGHAVNSITKEWYEKGMGPRPHFLFSKANSNNGPKSNHNHKTWYSSEWQRNVNRWNHAVVLCSSFREKYTLLLLKYSFDMGFKTPLCISSSQPADSYRENWFSNTPTPSL